jgi:beta-glucosidase
VRIKARRIRRPRLRAATLAIGAAAGAIAFTVAALPASAQPADGAVLAASDGSSGACPWMNTHQPADVRANELLSAMSLPETMMWLNEQNSYAFPKDYPQFCLPDPDLKYTNGSTGAEGNGGGVTAFAAPITLAAAWNPQLAYVKGQQQAAEAFGKGTNVILGPDVNIARIPNGGRDYEGFGEDPYLDGQIAAAEIQGIQHSPGAPVVAVVKHYDANNAEGESITARFSLDSVVDDRTLHEIYDPPFQASVGRGQAGGVMCAINQVNGLYSCQNPTIETTYLRDQMGFKGFVLSDIFAVHSTVPALDAGTDVELNVPNQYSVPNLEAALAAGTITARQIRTAAFRYLSELFRIGVFDTPLPATPAAVVSTPAHVATALQMSEQGSVLVKNQGGILPLSGTGKTIAVIGQTASATPTNGVSALNACGTAIDCSGLVDPLTAIQARAAQAGDTVVYNNGSDPAAAAAVAAKADYVIVFGYYAESEGHDHVGLNLDNGGDALISAVAAANPDTAVVLSTGGPVLMPWLSSVKAVLENWYGGQQMGPAIAALLWGDVNPSGKLPYTFPASLSQTPTSSPAQYPGIKDSNGIYQQHYSEGLEVGYRWYTANNVTPLFPFGYGLSYTSFSEKIVGVQPDRQGGVTVSVAVRNTGPRAGAQVVQLYVQDPAASDEPSRQLKGFQRVTLPVGGWTVVRIRLNRSAFAVWDTARQQWKAYPGIYQIQLGQNESSIVSQVPFYLQGNGR